MLGAAVPAKIPGQVSPLAQAMVDSFSMAFLATDIGTGTVDAIVSCELMNNVLTGLLVSSGSNISVIQGPSAEPCFSTVGSDKRLNCLLTNLGVSNDAWTSPDLMDGHPTYATTSAFDMIQDAAGSCWLAFAMLSKDGAKNDLYIANLAAKDITSASLAQLSSTAVKVQGLDPAFIVETVRLGSGDDGRRLVLTAEGSLPNGHGLYQLNEEDQSASSLELPESKSYGADSVLQHSTGPNDICKLAVQSENGVDVISGIRRTKVSR